MRLMGLEIGGLESVLQSTFAKKPAVVASNIDAAQAGYDYAQANFRPLAAQLQPTDQKWPRPRATTCSPWAPRWPAASSTSRTR